MHASLKALKQRESPADCANNQLDLFNHSVVQHTVTDSTSLCLNHAESSRCMMLETTEKVRKTYRQEWHQYDQAQINEKAKFLERFSVERMEEVE